VFLSSDFPFALSVSPSILRRGPVVDFLGARARLCRTTFEWVLRHVHSPLAINRPGSSPHPLGVRNATHPGSRAAGLLDYCSANHPSRPFFLLPLPTSHPPRRAPSSSLSTIAESAKHRATDDRPNSLLCRSQKDSGDCPPSLTRTETDDCACKQAVFRSWVLLCLGFRHRHNLEDTPSHGTSKELRGRSIL
jgi:hypothetical protein